MTTIQKRVGRLVRGDVLVLGPTLRERVRRVTRDREAGLVTVELWPAQGENQRHRRQAAIYDSACVFDVEVRGNGGAP